MIRLTFHRVKLSTQCRADSIPRRVFSLFRRKRSEGWVQCSFLETSISHVASIQPECVMPCAVTFGPRYVTSKAGKLEKNLEDEIEVDDEDEKNIVRKVRKRSKKKMEKTEYITDTSPLKEDNLELFMEMAKGDISVFNELRSLQMKVDILSKIYGVSPKISADKWSILLGSTSHLKKSYIRLLILNAIRDRNKKILKPKYELPPEDDTVIQMHDTMCYHLFHNSMFLKFRLRSLKRLTYAKAMASIVHGPEIFIDCSYDEFMNYKDSTYLAKQICNSMLINLKSEMPYHIILCNFDKKNNLGKSLPKYSMSVYEDYYPMTMTSKSYTELYPRDRLVYLTPHCNTILHKLDPDKRYIIGGYVDKSKSLPVSLGKAKEDKIEMAKLPLDKYLDWQKGKKSLCVNHVFYIMLILKNFNNDWEKALSIIPKRFLMKNEYSQGNKRKPESELNELIDYVSHFGENPFKNALKYEEDELIDCERIYQ